MSDPLTIACPSCAQQPQEWCAEWRDGVGMVPVPNLIHPTRVEAAAFREAVDSGASEPDRAVSDESFRAAVSRLL